MVTCKGEKYQKKQNPTEDRTNDIKANRRCETEETSDCGIPDRF